MPLPGRKKGRYTSLSGLQIITFPLSDATPYEKIVIDGEGRPLSFLSEWYRLSAMNTGGSALKAKRTRQTYFDMLLPFVGFQVQQGAAWNAPPEHVRLLVRAFLQQHLRCLVYPDIQLEGYRVRSQTDTPLSNSSLRVFLAALLDFYTVMQEAGYYIHDNPMQSQLLRHLQQTYFQHQDLIDSAEEKTERWEQLLHHPTGYFRLQAPLWTPDFPLELETVESRLKLRQTVEWMIQHAPYQRDALILRLLLLTGARISEILALTVGGYRAESSPFRARILNKGSFGHEEKLIQFTEQTEALLAQYLRTERRRADRHSARSLSQLADTEPIFLTRQGTPYTYSAFRYQWSQLLKRACRAMSCHAFRIHDIRHLHVTELLLRHKEAAHQGTLDYVERKRDVQLRMGWKSARIIEHYDHSLTHWSYQAEVADFQQAVEADLTYPFAQRPVVNRLIPDTNHQTAPQEFHFWEE